MKKKKSDPPDNFKCPLCGKDVYADVCVGKVTMFDPDGNYHRCWYGKSKQS